MSGINTRASVGPFFKLIKLDTRLHGSMVESKRIGYYCTFCKINQRHFVITVKHVNERNSCILRICKRLDRIRIVISHARRPVEDKCDIKRRWTHSRSRSGCHWNRQTTDENHSNKHNASKQIRDSFYNTFHSSA